MEYEIFTLDNGLKIIHKHVKDSDISHCGLIINSGSRDEPDGKSGLAHFIEHVLFKGTKKRKAFHILNRMETVGGEINAYTTKEETCIYASFMNMHYERGIDLIADISLHSVYPEKECTKEKEVIIDEINSYLDNPVEQIHDEFEEVLFAGHKLGLPILGTPESIKKITRKNILDFVKNNYTADNMVFASVGNITSEKLLKLVAKYFSSLKQSSAKEKRKSFQTYKPGIVIRQKEMYQSHCIIGNVAYGYKHPDKTAFILLNNLLGGPGMNSRLNLFVRERHGITYNIESDYTPYLDTGVFTIYLATDPLNLEKAINLVHKELDKLKNTRLGSIQLKQSKQQLCGQIAMAQDSKAGLMLSLGKSLLNFGRVDTLKETYRKIDSISASTIMEISNEIFVKDKMTSLIYKPN